MLYQKYQCSKVPHKYRKSKSTGTIILMYAYMYPYFYMTLEKTERFVAYLTGTTGHFNRVSAAIYTVHLKSKLPILTQPPASESCCQLQSLINLKQTYCSYCLLYIQYNVQQQYKICPLL